MKTLVLRGSRPAYRYGDHELRYRVSREKAQEIVSEIKNRGFVIWDEIKHNIRKMEVFEMEIKNIVIKNRIREDVGDLHRIKRKHPEGRYNSQDYRFPKQCPFGRFSTANGL